MSLIKPPKKEVFVMLSVRVEKDLFDKLKRYAEHLECTHAHIVSGAVAHVMKKDREFEDLENLRNKPNPSADAKGAAR